ncbi:MAG: type II secretion system protein [Microgenomates group bacterium]
MKKAFTLLEMLIVLGIIAVILSVLTVSYATAQKKSRDAKRRGDLKGVQNALEQYYSACGYQYPNGSSLNPPVTCAAAVGVNFLPTMPADPKTGVSYSYSSDGTTFSLCTTSIESDVITGYCVANQQ